jgi:cardiolipin synthase A/B
MMEAQFAALIFAVLHVLIQLALIVRVLLRPHREPASRIAWVVVIVGMPVLGIVAYILFGEVNIGWRRVRRMREVLARMPDVNQAPGADAERCGPTCRNVTSICFGWAIPSMASSRWAAIGLG